VNWNEVEVDLKKGFEIKRIWEAYAGEVTSGSTRLGHENRWPYFPKKVRRKKQKKVDADPEFS
jgi:hypothetical protein